ncbi:MAG: carboxypeptidase regulatory-like domain-containing protein [Isosphaeraceae bacterium]
MSTFLGPLLAAVILAQVSGPRMAEGEVVDDQGKPVADVTVVFHVPPSVSGKEYQAEAQTRTDAAGQFRMKLPPLGRMFIVGMTFLAYRPGSAITAKSLYPAQYRLVMRKPEPRTIRIEGPDGKPIAGARTTPRVFDVFNGATAILPESMAAPLAILTGPDGRATINYLAARDQLVAVRVSAEPIGTQDVLLVERPGRSAVEPVIAIRIKKTSRLAGRVMDGAGQPVAGQLVEIWSRGGGGWLLPNSVELRGGPLRTSADGRFQTPDNLMVGSTYRVVVRASGKEPIVSDWIPIGEAPKTLLPMRLRPLRSVGGRVVDRQGKPVANVEVFQSGDGPEPMSTRSGADGRFVLDGFRQGPAFVFARAEGFRFHGQLVREGEHQVAVELTRGNERPGREIRMLPESISPEESRALVRRLIEPLWKVVVEKGDDRTRYDTLRPLAMVDPASVLDKLESARFASKVWEGRLQTTIAESIAETDPEEAASVAESIADPAVRAGALIGVIDALPSTQRPRKLALLDRAALHARAVPDAAQRLRWVGEAAEHLRELGEVEKARSLFAEGVVLANQMTGNKEYNRAYFAAMLAPTDPTAALAIARDFKGARVGGSFRVVLGLRMMEQDPTEALWFWKEMHGIRSVGIPAVLARLPMGDPARALRFFENSKLTNLTSFRAEVYSSLALGYQKRDEPASRRAIDEVMRAFDGLMHERPEQLHSGHISLLPVIERIDPSLVPEFFWRYVASRPPSANPRTTSVYSPRELIRHVADYDREVAAALFDSSRDRIEHAEDRELANLSSEFETWSSFDPRAAVARLERVPVSPDPTSTDARIRVAGAIAFDHDRRRQTFGVD